MVGTGLLCALLCAASLLLWARSYGPGDRIEWKSHYEDYAAHGSLNVHVIIADGGIAVWTGHQMVDPRNVAVATAWHRKYKDFRHWEYNSVEDLPSAGPRGRDPAHDVHVALPGFWHQRWGGQHDPPQPFVPRSPYPKRQTLTVFPAWVPLVLSLLLSAIPLNRYRKSRLRRLRRASGRCVACGYDVRASPHACPECGRDPATGQEWKPGNDTGTGDETGTGTIFSRQRQ